jgi:hypothetical protein
MTGIVQITEIFHITTEVIFIYIKGICKTTKGKVVPSHAIPSAELPDLQTARSARQTKGQDFKTSRTSFQPSVILLLLKLFIRRENVTFALYFLQLRIL